MQSFKIKKDIENSAYPIEMMVRDIKLKGEISWGRMIADVTAVTFSGIGTTLCLQEEYLPRILKCVFKIRTASLQLFILEALLAFGIFALITGAAWGLIHRYYQDVDNKKTKESREELVDYYYKVVLNNILTGVSYVKKAWKKRDEYKKKDECIADRNKKILEIGMDQEAKDNLEKQNRKDAESQQYYSREIRLYICEAIFYFKTANVQFNEKHYFESGEREEYLELLQMIGMGTLQSVYEMYKKSLDNIIEIDKFVGDSMYDNSEDEGAIKNFLNDYDTKMKNARKEFNKI